MIHYIGGIKINMSCKHPNMEGNDCSTAGCDGKCETCKYGIAEMSITDCMKILEQYKKEA